MLSEELQTQTHDLARHSAVVKEIKSVWAFGMVDEGNREILDERLTDEAIDRGIHRRKLIAPGPRDEQRHVPSKIRDRAADARVCEAKLYCRVYHVGRTVEIKKTSAAEHRASRRATGVLHDGHERRRDVPRRCDNPDPCRIDPQRSSIFVNMLEECPKICDGITVRVSDRRHARQSDQLAHRDRPANLLEGQRRRTRLHRPRVAGHDDHYRPALVRRSLGEGGAMVRLAWRVIEVEATMTVCRAVSEVPPYCHGVHPV